MRLGRSGVIAKKIGMSRVFLPSGEACPVTLFSFEDCSVIAVNKSAENPEYCSLQLGAGKAKNVTKPLIGHFKKKNVEPKFRLKEFRISKDFELPVGAKISPDFFQLGDYVDVTGVTIGRGFAGGMKRHNFSGLRATHGVSVSHRSIGSTGHRKDPAKVFKGKKMPGHMGCEQVTVQTLKVMEIDIDRDILVVKGCVPGFEGGWVSIQDAVKKPLPNRQKMDGVRIISLEKEEPSQEV